MHPIWSVILLSACLGIGLAEVVCLPPNMDRNTRPDKESCEYLVNIFRDWESGQGAASVQTYVPPHVNARTGQHPTPRLVLDTRRSTQRTGRLCTAKIEVLAGKRPASITVGETASAVANIVTECLIRRRTLGYKRGGTNRRIKLSLESYTKSDDGLGHDLPVNGSGWNQETSDTSRREWAIGITE